MVRWALPGPTGPAPVEGGGAAQVGDPVFFAAPPNPLAHALTSSRKALLMARGWATCSSRSASDLRRLRSFLKLPYPPGPGGRPYRVHGGNRER